MDEIKQINKYYFHDFQINLDNDDFEFNMEGVLDANVRVTKYGIPFHPHVKTSGIEASTAAFFKDLGVSSDNNVHLNVCLSDVKSDISDISYGYGYILDQYVINGILDKDKMLNDQAQATLDAATATLADASNCIDLTNQIGISYPEFLEPVAIQSARTKIRNNSIIAYGCPVAKSKIDGVVVVNDGPCGTVAYKFSIYTADDIDNAGTNSRITATLCGDDISGSRKCFDTKLNSLTKKGQISHVLVENSSVLIDNLSLTLTSDNSGKKPEWFVDSVAVDMKLPNNSTFHRWFPVNSWIGGDAPETYTFNQRNGLQVYTFTVSTGNKSMFSHAGTNSHILADVCDVNNKCLTFNLDKDGYHDFEAGSTTTYTIVTSEKLADVISMTLHNVYNGEHPGWYVQDVVYSHYSFPENKDHSIKDGQGFMFRQWLADGRMVLLFETFLFAEDYSKLLETSSTVKMQTLIGETAINNVLNAYFVGKHEIPVNGLGTVTVTINNLGIDIQGKDNVVFGYDLTIASDFSSEISNITGGLMKGSIPFKDAFSVQEIQNAYVTFMSLNKTMDAILVSYGIKSNPVSTAIKKVFETSDGMIELWRQEYSSLISASLKDAASSLDLSLVSKNLTYSVGGRADYIVIDLELNIKSNQQYFWIEGNFINSDKTILASNKEFKALEITYSAMENFPIGDKDSCPNYPKSNVKQIDLIKACSDRDLEMIKGAVRYQDFHLNFRIKTKHGGIVSFRRDIKQQGTH